MGQWRGRVPLHKLKLSRGERATIEEQIDDLVDAIQVQRAITYKRNIYVMTEHLLAKKIWRLYLQQVMTPTRSSYFAEIIIENNTIKLMVNEMRIGSSMETKLPEYNWRNETHEYKTYEYNSNNPRGHRILSLLLDNFDELHSVIAKVMNYVR